MKTYKKIIISILIILSLFSIITGVSANNLNNDTSTITDTNHDEINHSANQDLNDKSTIMTNHNVDDNEKTKHDDRIKSERKDKQLSDTDIIYVAPNDDMDYGEGSETKPYASINKAVTKAKTGSGKIIIKEGNYHENGIIIDGNQAISIIGEGQVVIDNTGLEKNSIFSIETKDVTIKNIIFRNNEAKYGSAFYIRGESQTNPIEVNMLIENCGFENLEANRGTAIYAYNSKGNINITNSNFTNSKATWASICIQESSDTGGLNLKINDSKFANNYANNAGALYISKAANVTITNSIFYNNTASNSPGAMYINNCTAKFDKCLIYNNTASNNNPVIVITRRVVYNTGYDDDSSVSNNLIIPTNAVITNCIIENNTPIGSKVPVILLETSNLNISYSSLVNGFDIENTIKESLSNDKPGNVTANNNWWGIDDPFTKVTGDNIQIDNWITMNVKTNASIVESGDKLNVSVDFNHVKTKNGEVEYFSGWNIPKTYIVSFNTSKGIIDSDKLEIKYGEVKNIIYTANVVPDTLSVSCDGFISHLKIKDSFEPYFGVIYVSKTGNDLNDGSYEYPVESISKAIELASFDDASGEIIIMNGTYRGFDYEINKDLSITGQGKVIVDGDGESLIFNAKSSVNRLLLSNLIIKDGKYDYGAAVRSYARETILDNITIIGLNNDYTGSLILAYYDLSINNSKISGHSGGEVITSSRNILINNSLFENNLVNSGYGLIYQSSQRLSLIVENSNFINNTALQSVLYTSNNANIKVKNSNFINNTNTIGTGGAICVNQNSKLKVDNSSFINNQVSNSMGRNGGAISVLSNSEAIIGKSMFINNSATGFGDAIYNNGKLTINYSVLLSNNTNPVIYSENNANAQFNWWGSNNNPKNLVSNNVDTSNWVIMNVDVPNEVHNMAIFTVDFKHYQSTSTINELKDDIPRLIVNVEVINGTVNKKVLYTNDNLARVVYSVINEGYDQVRFSSNDANIIKDIKVSKKQDESVIVTPDNIEFFFDNNGYLNPKITSQELVFTGEFKDLNLKIDRLINLTGKNALFNNINLNIRADNVKINNINFVANKSFNDTNSILYTEAKNTLIENNNFTYTSPNDMDSFVININSAERLKIQNNNINYIGKLGEDTKTIAIYGIDSEAIDIKNNNITAIIPSVPTYPTRSSGLLLENTENSILENNNINVKYNTVDGTFDSIYAIQMTGETSTRIIKNHIIVNGSSYAYGLSFSGFEDIEISKNNINSIAKKQTNAIDINGKSSVNIVDNNISSIANVVVYPINLSDYEKHSANADIKYNNIIGEANSVYGVYTDGYKNIISNNNIELNGNYTIGITAYKLSELIIKDNIIRSNGNNIGEAISPQGSVPVETTGISVKDSKVEIINNTLISNGKYTIHAMTSNGIIKDNKLYAISFKGDLSINNEDSDLIVNNNTSINPSENHENNPNPDMNTQHNNNPKNLSKIKKERNTNQKKKETVNSIPIKEISLININVPKSVSKKAKKLVLIVKLKVKGKIAKNAKVKFIINGKTYTVKTNNKGIAKLVIKKVKLKKLVKKFKIGMKLKYKVKYGKKILSKKILIKK